MDLTQIAALIGSVTGLISLILFSKWKIEGMRIKNERDTIKTMQTVIDELRKESDKRKDQDEKEKKILKQEKEILAEKFEKLSLDVELLKRTRINNSLEIDMYIAAINSRHLCPKKGECAITVKLEDLKKEYKEIKK